MARKGGSSFSVQIEGAEELEAKLKAMGAEINTGAVLEEAMMDGAEIVRGAVQSSAPVRSGQLSGSIEVSKQGREKHSVRIGPTGAGFYGRFLEYGTSKMSARPFVRPAFDGVRVQAEAAISEAIWRAVQDAI